MSSYSSHSLFQQLDHQVTATLTITRGCPIYHYTAGEEPYLASLYSKLQATWTTGGISCRLLCGAVFVGMFTGLPDSHHFPIQRKVGAHEHCARQQPLFWFLQNFLLDFWQHPSPFLFLIHSASAASPSCLHRSSLSASSMSRGGRHLDFYSLMRKKIIETVGLQRPRV